MKGEMLFAALAASLALGGYAEANQACDISADEIAAAVRADLDHEIRPGGVNGSPFWNGYSRFFMYPPAFDFPAVKGATEYRYEVVDAKGGVHVFTAPVPTASLKALWPELPSGWTTVTCFAITQKPHYRPASPMVSRCFWKQAPFTGDYPAAVRGYGEAARLAKAWLRNQDAYRSTSRRRKRSAIPSRVCNSPTGSSRPNGWTNRGSSRGGTASSSTSRFSANSSARRNRAKRLQPLCLKGNRPE